jgi:serine/threonine protein kinase
MEDFATFVKAEHEALEMIQGFDTQHLIKAIAFYKKNHDFFFVFPWAQHGNLRKFWNEKIPSIYDKNYMKWVFTQFVGLADAIRTLHHQEDDKSSRHGDLKPENVLCFDVSGPKDIIDQTSCVLVISDVGVTRTHDESTEFRTRTMMESGVTVPYRAPERELNPDLSTGRRYDIWSLGCLYLEFVIWLLYGIEELERFRLEIRGKFYTISDTRQADTLRVEDKTAEINQEVKTWINNIKTDPRCAGAGPKETAIGRLVDLIEKRLLVVKATSDRQGAPRASSQPEGAQRAPTGPTEGTDGPSFQFIVHEPTGLSDDIRKRKAAQAARFADSGEGERAYAIEVCKKLETIARNAEDGIIEWLHVAQDGDEDAPYDGSATDLVARPRRASAGRNQEVSTIPVSSYQRLTASNILFQYVS